MTMTMRTFRLSDKDIATLEEATDKIAKAAKKEGVTFEVTKSIVLRTWMSLGNEIPIKEMLEHVKKMKIYG